MENEIQEPQPQYGFKKNIMHEEYLEMDANSERKVEYFNGKIFIKDGETLNHNQILTNSIGEIGNQLKSSQFKILASNMRIASPDFQSFAYPDAIIVNRKIELHKNVFDTLINPIVLIEITSLQSVEIDYRAKFLAYKQIPSVQEYIIIDYCDFIAINVYKRLPNNQWLNKTYLNLSEQLVLESVEINIPLEELFENVTLPLIDEYLNKWNGIF